MNLRKRKTQIWWMGQLIALCLMLSTPFWLREDLEIFQPVLRSLTNSDASDSSLAASQVLVLDFEKLEPEQAVVVNSRQLRLASPVRTLASSNDLRAPASLKSRHRETKETWSLAKVEKIPTRAPASESREWIKIHNLDESERVSEYFEIGNEPCDLILHFVSSSQKSVQKKVSLSYRSQLK